jgi:hypothetical protein
VPSETNGTYSPIVPKISFLLLIHIQLGGGVQIVGVEETGRELRTGRKIDSKLTLLYLLPHKYLRPTDR